MNLRPAWMDDPDYEDDPFEDDDDPDDPYLQLGFGVASYYSFLVQCIIMLACISVICTPLYLIYNNGALHEDA